MIRKLRVKFIAVLMAVVTVLMCIIFGLILGFTKQSMDEAAMKVLQRGSAPGFLPDPRGESSGLPYFVLTMDMRGNLLVSGTVSSDAYGQEEFVEFWNQAVESSEDSGIVEGYRLRYLRTGTPMSASIVFVDVTSQQITMTNLINSCLMIGGISLVLIFAAAVFLAKWMTRPVEQAWQQQKQFVADASHELKTPLTVIMTNAELLQQAEGEVQSPYLGGILTMARQMRSLVEGMLELARVDNGAVKTAFVPLDLSLLVADGVLPFEPLYFEKGLTLESRIEDRICVRGSVAHLQQVVEILLDNAMKYSAAGGRVWIELRRQGNAALLRVANTGEPIGPEDQKRLFERFYRADKARSRDGSFGLGLSIAQRVVAEHRGRIWVESNQGVNAFFVQIPLL